MSSLHAVRRERQGLRIVQFRIDEAVRNILRDYDGKAAYTSWQAQCCGRPDRPSRQGGGEP